MREATRPVLRVFLLVAFAAAALTIGCAKKVAPKAPEAPPPAPPPASPTVTLQANPTSIKKGESSTLTWSSTNATQLSIDQGVGSVAPQGTTTVSPSDTTTYTISATGPGGSANATASVSVEAPPPPQPPPAPSWRELFDKDVQDAYFDYNKADIRPDARDALAKTADFLRNYPEAKVTIEGHCDERGSTEYNLALGDRRANAVKQYLVSLGISADRMSTISYGKERPFCTEHDETCWQQNRRGHFIPAQ
jgi:peptidoglycan-associated lipoprotein